MAIIFGTAGADTITESVNTAGGSLATAGPDQIYGGPDGVDSLAGGGGDDALNSSFANGSTLDGGSGDDSLYGSDNGQYLIGGEGNDSLEGAAGADTLFGGTGQDTINLYADVGGSSLGAMDSIVGFDAAAGDRLQIDFGFAGNTLPFFWRGSLSNAFASIQLGFALPVGGALVGIAGYWVPRIGGDGWLVLDFDRNGVVGANDFVAFVDTADDGPLTFGAFLPGEFSTATGSEGPDVITGFAGPVAGLGGNDSLAGTSEADSINGGEGGDTLRGAAGRDTLLGEGGNDNIAGNSGADSLDGGSGNDTLTYGSIQPSDAATIQGVLVDLLAGTATDNWGNLDSIAGFESVVGSVTDDTMFGGNGNDSLFGDAGADSIVGRDGNDRLFGGLGADTLDGGNGDDFLRPFDGDDRVFGGPGFDTASYNGDTGPIEATIQTGTDGQNATVTSALGADTLSGIDALDATSGDDRIEMVSVDTNVGIQIRGLAGADTIIGPSTPSTSILADYLVGGVTQGINVDLISGVVSNDGFGSQDRLVNITFVRGTNFDDVILGSDFNDRIRGRGGNDTLDGRGGTFDNLDYSNSPGPVVVDLATGIVSSDGDGGADSVAGFELVRATSGGDSIRGSDVAETFEPYSGADTIDGGGNQDRVNYFSLSTGGTITAPAVPLGIIADLVAGTVRDPWGTTDIVISIERVTGTSLADTMIGGAEANRFNGRGGNDSLDGGLGGDYAEYSNASAGVRVDLTQGRAFSDGEGGADTLVSIEHVIGSAQADTLTGVAQLGRSPSDLRGGAGDDLLIGIPGEYVRADYADQIAGMFIDLGAGTALDRFGDTDTLVDIRGLLMFGDHADTLLGSAEDEWIAPSEGADSVDAGGGFDIIGYGGVDVGGVVVNLATQRATDTNGDADTIIGFEGVATSFGDDTVIGDAGDNLISVSSGADSADGGLGEDTISYSLGFSPGGVEYTVNEFNDRLPVQGVSLDLVTQRAMDFSGSEDTILGFEHAIGSTANDTLRGSATGNRLSGAEGNDVLEGREGDDTLAGQWGNDSLDGGAGVNTAVFDGNLTDFAITALAGGRLRVSDLRAGAPEGADTLAGIAFLEFADTVIATGGPTPGDDSLEGTAAGDTIDALGGADSVAGLAGADRLLGNEGDDTLSGGAENDTLLGGAGHDSLDGGTGADSMLGGAGNDTYRVDDAADRPTESRDAGTDTVLSAITWTLGAHLENLVLLGDAAIDGTGNGLNNMITGNDAANVLNGGGRADTLIGGGGNDLYLIDATDVLIEQAGGGNDTVVANATFTLADHIEVLRFNGTANVRGDGNAADNFMLGNVGNNRLLGYDGNDTLNGGAGNDTLQGGEGADSLVGGEGVDRLDGGNGDDTYVLVDADLVIELANAGTDIVLSNIAYTLPNAVENLSLLGSADLAGTGNALQNVLNGNSGANLLRGLGEADRISGGGGADTIEGGLGADTLSGGGGTDRFLWLTPAEGGDTITDFVAGSEKLVFANAAFGALGVGALNPANFANNAPTGAVPQFVYTKATGVLEWDADGTGGIAAVTIATLSNKPTLTAGDVLIA